MKIIGIQNNTSINQPHLGDKKVLPKAQKQDYSYQYNPIYYMPVFKSQVTDDFTRLFNQGLKEDLPQDKLDKLSRYIYKIKKDVTNDEDNFLGEGSYSSVYKINDDYVLKVNHKSRRAKNGKFEYKKNEFNDLPYYYGGVLATCDNLSILKNADPKGNAILAGRPYWEDGIDGVNYLFDTSLPAFANLPQSAYDNYANVLKLLNDKSGESNGIPERYLPDIFNPNNFMIVDDEIRIVDGIMVSCDDDEWNDLGTMILPFFEDIDSCFHERSPEIIRNEKEIFKKCVLASEEAELPLPYNPCSLHSIKGIMEDIYQDTYKDTYAKDLVDFIKSTREQEPDKDKRKQVISDYLDNME